MKRYRQRSAAEFGKIGMRRKTGATNRLTSREEEEDRPWVGSYVHGGETIETNSDNGIRNAAKMGRKRALYTLAVTQRKHDPFTSSRTHSFCFSLDLLFPFSPRSSFSSRPNLVSRCFFLIYTSSGEYNK